MNKKEVRKVKKPPAKNLKGFAAYMLKSHLKAFVTKQLRITNDMNISLPDLFSGLTKQQIIEMSMISSKEFLISLEENTALEIAKKNIKTWEEDKIPGVSRHDIQSSDLILKGVVQKKALYYFLPGYTTDAKELISIVNELLDYYTKVQDEGFQTFFRIQKMLVEDFTAQKKDIQYTRSLIESSRDPLFTIRPEGTITDINEAAVKVTSLSREKLIGSDFINYFTEPDKARECYEQVFLKGFVADYPLTITDRNFTSVLFNGSVYKNDRGVVIGAVVVARDLTEQKRAAERLENSLKEISDYKYALDESSIVAVTDQKGIIKYANDNFCKTSKFTREELIGNDHRIISSQYHAKEFIRDLWKRITKGKIWRGELKNKGKDGNIYWVDTTIVPFLNKQGKPYQYVAIKTDITQRKIDEIELLEAKVAAELATGVAEEAKCKAENATRIAVDAVKAKQQFLSNMSHEIRTPMNAIIGFTKVMLKTDLTTKQNEYLTAIKLSGDALIVLINDILDLAKVDAGKIKFEQIPFKMALSISAMLHLFETKIQEKNLLLVKEYDGKIPEVLLGDPVRLHQVILNLVSNAVKFTSEGKITVSLRLLKEDEEKVKIEFSVSDTGIGIAKNKTGKIFETFQQATSGTSRIFGGTGLGLAIVKQLVEQQGGNVTVKSTPGEGSIFSFVLSFLKTTIEMESETETMELDTKIKNIKVLVAEDMALNQLLMKTLLDDFGFERDIAANGKIAIEKLKAKSYDIILMDLQMPIMNGFEATEYIRSILNSDIPIMALTADVTTSDLERCKAVGMNDYIAKPLDERILYRKIVDLVKKPLPVKTNQQDLKNLRSASAGMKAYETRPKDEMAGQEEGLGNGENTKCINLDYLKKRTKSDPGLMMEMISLYLEQTMPLINSMKQSLEEKDWNSLGTAIHQMIPTFSLMGINKEFENMARQVHDYAHMNYETSEAIPEPKTDEITSLVLQLEENCIQACKELEKEFASIKKNLANWK